MYQSKYVQLNRVSLLFEISLYVWRNVIIYKYTNAKTRTRQKQYRNVLERIQIQIEVIFRKLIRKTKSITMTNIIHRDSSLHKNLCRLFLFLTNSSLFYSIHTHIHNVYVHPNTCIYYILLNEYIRTSGVRRFCFRHSTIQNVA